MNGWSNCTSMSWPAGISIGSSIGADRMSNNGHSELLLNSELFRFVPAPQRERLCNLFTISRYEFGDLIVRQGEPADAFFVLAAGRARVVKMNDAGQELSLNLLRSGAQFGEAALLSGGVRNASVRCSSAVEALRLERKDFLDLLEQFP